jgi:hypothetical protein
VDRTTWQSDGTGSVAVRRALLRCGITPSLFRYRLICSIDFSRIIKDLLFQISGGGIDVAL